MNHTASKNLIKYVIFTLSAFSIVVLSIKTISKNNIYTDNNSSNKIITQRNCYDTPEKCCEHPRGSGTFYPVGFERGPYVCRPSGEWGKKS